MAGVLVIQTVRHTVEMVADGCFLAGLLVVPPKDIYFVHGSRAGYDLDRRIESEPVERNLLLMFKTSSALHTLLQQLLTVRSMPKKVRLLPSSTGDFSLQS
jgi:hypothetical protein